MPYKFNPLPRIFDLVNSVIPPAGSINTLSAQGGIATGPNGVNFDFSGTSTGAILFIAGDGLMQAAVQVDGTTIAVNGSNQLMATGQMSTLAITTSQTLVKNTRYLVTSSSVSLALPTTASSTLGDTIEVILAGGTSWAITEATSQQIKIGNQATTVTSGSVTTNADGDWIEIIYQSGGLWRGNVKQGNLNIN